MPLEEFVAQAHAALRGTRGAALLAVRFGAQTVHSCGAGNISGRLFNGVASLSLSSQHGTAGVQISRPRVADCSSLDHGVLGLHSDGDRKSTRLNSSHLVISYAGFCLKKKH